MNRDDINLSNRLPGVVPGFEVGPFDEYDSDLMHDLMGNERMGDATASLLQAYRQVLRTQDSFGADAEKSVKFLMEHLAAFRAAVKAEFEDSL